jgi:hypothetical protein
MDICTTSIECKCGYNCTNCSKAKELYLNNTHAQCSQLVILKKLPNNSNAACEEQKTEEKEKRKTMFEKREKQPKTTSYYCFKNMQYNDIPCCNQCFQLIETTMDTK